MKVLLIGNGGREHALAWRLGASPSVSRIICPNGNPGIARHAETPRVSLQLPEEWAAYARAEGCDLAVIGPEGPLAAGVADAMIARGIPAFGPVAAGARLESSKAFCREVLEACDVPMARGSVFTDADEAKAFARSLGLPVVVKADGLAAGKGVTVAATWDETDAAIVENLRDLRFGEASSVIVIEECLRGREVSLIALTDGECVYPLIPAEDYKRLGDGDVGPNTGGMGCAAPTPVMNEETLAWCYGEILVPVVEELRKRGIVYRGALYAGIMLTDDGPRVLEFNCRFGDPETQVLMPLIEGNLGEIFMACATGNLAPMTSSAPHREGEPGRIGFRPDAAVTVVLASEGYPANPRTGVPISGLSEFDGESDVMVFHAGTKQGDDGAVITAGGRVLCATAWAPTVLAAKARAEYVCSRLNFSGMNWRRDIGSRALQSEG
jgi:phosphoribosylamine--glycine ligase